jgi:hypothetical protein
MCRNCGASALGRFCATCGQATTVEPPTARAFVHDFVEHYVALEGALWRTLGALLLRPGRLTLEYFAGRRGRYIPPLRLYLTFSLILFALIGITGGDLKLGSAMLRFQASAPVNRPAGDDALNLDLNPRLDISKAPAWLGRPLARVEAMSPVERSDRIRNGMNRSLPYVMMLLVPLLALITQIAYWNRRRLYGEHLVVALHAQTVVFIFMLLSAPPWPNWVGNLLLALLVGQGAIAMQRIYGGRFVTTMVRLGMIIVVYSALVFAAIAVLAFAALLF